MCPSGYFPVQTYIFGPVTAKSPWECSSPLFPGRWKTSGKSRDGDSISEGMLRPVSVRPAPIPWDGLSRLQRGHRAVSHCRPQARRGPDSLLTSPLFPRVRTRQFHRPQFLVPPMARSGTKLAGLVYTWIDPGFLNPERTDSGALPAHLAGNRRSLGRSTIYLAAVEYASSRSDVHRRD